MSEKIKLKINKTFGKFIAGKFIDVLAIKGIPLDQFWRDRIADSAIDGCVSIIKKQKSKKVKEGIDK